ncbi:extensin family protein, partial [Methylopila musalis]
PAPSARERDPDCQALARLPVVAAPSPPILGPGSCGAALPVALSAVTLTDGREVTIAPAATLTCAAAVAAARLIRDDLAPAAAEAGVKLSGVHVAASYVCRGRNNRKGAKMSEHGLANAVDLSGFSFDEGRRLGVYDDALPKEFAAALKPAACARFATVLGQGSDGLHEDHLHLDLRKRRNPQSRLCQWTVD